MSYSTSSSELSFSDTDFGVFSASFLASTSGSFLGTFGDCLLLDLLLLVGDGLIFRFFGLGCGLGFGLDCEIGFDFGSALFSDFLVFLLRNFFNSSGAVSLIFFSGSQVGSQGFPFSSVPDHLTRYLVLPLKNIYYYSRVMVISP